MANHPDDIAAIERMHSQYLGEFFQLDINDLLMRLQDEAYQLGRTRGMLEAKEWFAEQGSKA
jgi:hypothetical protein